MFKKIFIAIIAAAILFSGTSVAFAYWDNLQDSYNTNISIGEGVTLKMDVITPTPNGVLLVPEGKGYIVDSVEEIELTYNVYLDKNTTEDLNLTVTSSNVLIGGSDLYADLINIDIEQESEFVNDSAVAITVTITITDPQDFSIYEEIINQAVTFTLTFEATV